MSRNPYGYDGSVSGAIVGVILCVIAVFAVIYLAAAGMFRLITFGDANNTYPTASDILKAEHVNFSGPQPLELGRAIEGTQGHIDVSSDGFSGLSLEASMHPASAVRLGWSHEGMNYILEVPYQSSPFKQVPHVTPVANVHLNNEDVYDYGSLPVHCESWLAFGSCHVNRSEVKKIPGWHELEQKGFGSLVQDHIDSVKLTLTPEQYQAYLKGSGVTK
jgi:hypothetical protein